MYFIFLNPESTHISQKSLLFFQIDNLASIFFKKQEVILTFMVSFILPRFSPSHAWWQDS